MMLALFLQFSVRHTMVKYIHFPHETRHMVSIMWCIKNINGELPGSSNESHTMDEYKHGKSARIDKFAFQLFFIAQ